MPQSSKTIIRWAVVIPGLLFGYSLTEAFRDGWSNATSGILANHNLLIDSKVSEYAIIACGAMLLMGGYSIGNRVGLLSTARRLRFWFWLAYLPLALFAAIDIGFQTEWSEAIFILVLVMFTIAPILSLLFALVWRKTEGMTADHAKA